ncbi:PAS-domain containing protein [Limobrevibacterium gyesilva]|uniref:histidine kinase n=1 Tax=Limobrevibacterium gyesilva TaxID=2991712 RepID=A0AA41YU62_9PROT|nr:PAS-domain containing protein [Limobrevibacterium gyesilva]MCW3476633.1 PAS-domain containing protein [Limobrevibacterium gyesilva]
MRLVLVLGLVVAGVSAALIAESEQHPRSWPAEGSATIPEPPGAASSLVTLLGLGMATAGALLLFREARGARRRELQMAQDGTARAEAKAALLQVTLSAMADGVMMVDADLRLVQWNDRYPELTGVPREILRPGVTMEEMVRAQARLGEFGPLDGTEALEAEVKRRIALMRSYAGIGVAERLRPDGRSVELRRAALPGGGIVTFYTDITARKQAEAARREARRAREAALEQKAQALAMVSHEIRVPLNAVISSLALLEEEGLSDAQRRLADTARQAGDTLLDLVNDILDLSKMDAGRLELRPTEFELRPLLAAVCGMFRAPAAARGVRLQLDVAADVPVLLFADAGRLRQVVMNFVSNAAKFSRPGVVLLRAAMVPLAGQPGVRLAVRDQGPRIAEAQAAQLFQPFVRLDDAVNAGAPGTGLGLAICERLAGLMGGKIGLAGCAADAGDGLGDGNEFWLVLPLADAPANPVARPAPMARLRRAAVLLVEDIATNRLLTAALLRREGHRVDTADSGAEAVRLVTHRPYDLVLMDLNMPGVAGCEAVGRIRALPAPAGQVPVIVLTGSATQADVACCLDLGVAAILAKPLRPAELFDMLARTIGPAAAPPSAAPFIPNGIAGCGLVDAAHLAELQRGLPSGLFATLVEQCLTDIHARLDPLKMTLAMGDAAAAISAAHALAGMAGSYGFTAVERRMRRVMALAGAADLGGAAAALQGLETELDQSTSLIRGMLQAQAA